ncbi:MAG TPA: hypothetical protein VD886_12065 [Herpetosiphonaceae bacterium]|nr:hypothetical protein [Herpetosiphonaceae bacterium]
MTSEIQTMTPAEARAQIIKGVEALPGWQINGQLNLSQQITLTRLPSGIRATSINLNGCVNLREIPPDLVARRISLRGCTALASVPAGLRCYDLDLRESGVREIPAGISVDNRLDLSDCRRLGRLPDNLRVGSLVLRNCTALRQLPEGMDVSFLDIAGCTGLRDWPATGAIRVGRLDASGCTRLRSLPAWLTTVAQLNLSGCGVMSRLPEGLRVTSWLDLGDSSIASLPESMRDVNLRWRGVPVSHRVAFQPETITVDEIIDEENAELRRVLMERMGYETFLEQADADTIDRDRDPGGERRLLRVPIEDDEDLVCLAVICPSTGRQYILRVPPSTNTCHQAAAWIAGFDNPALYRPLIET